MLDAVVYDFGGVFIGSPFEVVRRFADGVGIAHDDAFELVFGAYDADTDHPWHRAERGELELEATRTAIADLGRARGVEVDLFELFAGIGGGGVNEAMVASVERARSVGCRTAILTNNVAEAREFWRPLLPLQDLFDVVVDSSEEGVRKPDPRIYRRTLERLGGPEPGRVAFLDDFPGNVAVAERLGLLAILVEDDGAQAIARLDRLLGGGAV